ncbi:MAG: MFS transporter [Pseudomonadota bacterium]
MTEDGPRIWRTTSLIILAGCIIAILSFGPRSAFGLFQTPMVDARGWTREIFSLAFAIQNLLWGVGQPIAGMMADRFGTAKVLSLGAVAYMLGLVLSADATTPMALHMTAGVLMGLGMSACSFSLVLAAFGRQVSPEQRSMAFGIGTAAGSFGQFLFAPLGVALIGSYGWENSLVIMGGLVMLIPFLAIVLAGKGQAAAGNVPEQTMTAALGEAFGHRSYVLLVIGFFVCGFHVAFITAHLPAYITDNGIDASWGGWAIALIGLFNIIGSLASGWIGQRFPKPYLLAAIYLARSVVILIFLLTPPSPASILVFSAAMGLLWLSTVPPTSALVAVMFGPRFMATLFGFVFFSHQIGAFIGVWLGGRLFDTTGSYDVVWWLSIALGVAAALIHWPIREAPVARPQPA